MKLNNLIITTIIGVVIIVLTTILFSGCSTKSAPEDNSKEGLGIIHEYENVKALYEGRKNMGSDLVPEEVKNREVYYYTEDTEASPREYFYLEETGKLYLLKEGCWFCVNEDYKNVTPKESNMYEVAEEIRELFKAESKKN